MVGIVKKIDGDGFGIIACADGSKIPFIRADIKNRNRLEPGERVVFSLPRGQGCGVRSEHKGGGRLAFKLRLGILGRALPRPD